MSTALHRGRCLCGAVQYELTAAPLVVTNCHCASCRRATGAAMVPWATFRAEAFSVTRGELTQHESSRGVWRTHCARCGTSITYRRDSRPDEIDVTVGSLDEPDSFAPTAHIWVEHKLAWVVIGDGVPQYPKTLPE